MMRVVWIAAALVLATWAVPVASAQDVEYHYMVEDAEFDEADSCTPWWDTSLNGACDLLSFEAGNDDENLYLRFTMGAVSPNPQAAVALRASLTGAGETRMVQFMMWNGGTEDRDGCSDTGPLPDGMTHDRQGNAGLVTIPLASLDAEPGAELQLGTLEVRQLVRDPRPGSVMLCGVVDDAAPAGPIPVLGGSVEAGEAATRYQNITDALPAIALGFDNATDGDYVFNWTHDLTAFDLQVAGDAQQGTARLAVLAANETAFETNITELLDGRNHTAHSFEDATPGDWQFVLNFTGFIGNVTVEAVPPEPPDDQGPGGDAGTSDQPGDESTGNATGNATLDDTDDAESPAWALLPLLGTLFVVAARRRT